MAERNEGGCVCGAVRYLAHGDPERVTVCHCTWCPRRTGSAFGVEAVFKIEAVTISGDPLRDIQARFGRVRSLAVDQEFCARCGANIGITLEVVPGIRTIAAGTFDDPSWLAREKHSFRNVYLRSAQDWSELPGGVERYEVHFRK